MSKQKVNGRISAHWSNTGGVLQGGKIAYEIYNPYTKWYERLWFIVSNPFLYVITGKIRW